MLSHAGFTPPDFYRVSGRGLSAFVVEYQYGNKTVYPPKTANEGGQQLGLIAKENSRPNL